jgi:hypothetical protein
MGDELLTNRMATTARQRISKEEDISRKSPCPYRPTRSRPFTDTSVTR